MKERGSVQEDGVRLDEMPPPSSIHTADLTGLTPFCQERIRARSQGWGSTVLQGNSLGSPERPQGGQAVVSGVGADAYLPRPHSPSKRQATQHSIFVPTHACKGSFGGPPPNKFLFLKTKDRLVAILRGGHITPGSGKQICRGQRLDKRHELATYRPRNDFLSD